MPSGKSRAFINDVPVTLDILKELTSQLIDIHSQFETSNLFTSEYQFKIIDGLSDNKTLIENYQQDFYEFQTLKTQLKKFQTQLSENTKESDYKQFLLSELEDMKMDDVNYPDLQNQLSMQENAGMISENLGQLLSRFHQEEIGILSFLMKQNLNFLKLQKYQPTLQSLTKDLKLLL